MANIQGMVVAKEHQRKGYGKELMKAAEDWARERNIEMVRLNSCLLYTSPSPRD